MFALAAVHGLSSTVEKDKASGGRSLIQGADVAAICLAHGGIPRLFAAIIEGIPLCTKCGTPCTKGGNLSACPGAGC